MRRFLPLLVLALAPPAGQASVYSVGSGAGCTHSALSTALAAAIADASPGPHVIKLDTITRSIANYEIADPAQDITLVGGHANCTDALPTAGERSTLSNSSGPGARLLSISNPNADDRRVITLQHITLRGGAAPPDIGWGGAILATGRVTVHLQRGVIIEDNQASNGGGVALLNLTSDVNQFTTLFLQQGAQIEDNQATGAGSSGNGGGIYALGGTRVILWDGGIGFNTARRAGGGLFLGDALARAEIAPENGPEVVLIHNNTAGQATFSASEGFGGGIATNQGLVSVTGFKNGVAHGLWLLNNTANFGGAVHATGPTTGIRTVVNLRNTMIYNNAARAQGGALYSHNGVQWLVDHDREGACPLLGPTVPCSYIAENRAELAGGGSVGGGVLFMSADGGSLHGVADINRTLLEGNEDVNGLAAVAEASTGGRINLRRSVMVGNSAGGPGTQRTLIGVSGTDIDFLYNTILDNDIDGFFFRNGGVLRPQGSIWWDPGATVQFVASGATMAFNTVCLVTHTTSGLPSGVAASAWTTAPRLDDTFSPRGNSPAVDHCHTTGVDPGDDLYGRSAEPDVPGVANHLGTTDLGAVELVDALYANSFGNRPAN